MAVAGESNGSGLRGVIEAEEGGGVGGRGGRREGGIGIGVI